MLHVYWIILQTVCVSGEPAGIFYNTESRNKYERNWHEQVFVPSLWEVRNKVTNGNSLYPVVR